MRRAIADARTAVGFLTRIPVGRAGWADPVLTRAAAYFPLVGVLVAAIGLGTWWVGASALGPAAGAVLGVLATVVVTGALHEDGLADTVDGLWGGSTPARRLEIMRDSRIGTYGVIAVGGDLLLRTAVLVPYTAGEWLDVARILLAGHVLGRVAPLVLATALPPARTDGQGIRLAAPTRAGAAIAAITVVVGAVAAAGWWAPALVAAAAVAVGGLGLLAHRRIGGVTGDVLGAAVLLTNLAVAGALAALIEGGLVWGG